jgi:hypothetical protein
MFVLPRRPRPLIAHPDGIDNPLGLRHRVDQLLASVHKAAANRTSAHEAERAIWQGLLALVRAALALFFALQSSGDLGDSVALPDSRTCARLRALHLRR